MGTSAYDKSYVFWHVDIKQHISGVSFINVTEWISTSFPAYEWIELFYHNFFSLGMIFLFFIVYNL